MSQKSSLVKTPQCVPRVLTSDSVYQDILSIGNATNFQESFLFIDNATNQLHFQIRGIGTRAQSTTTVTDGQWHHVAVVHDGSTNIQLYIDGIADGSATTTDFNNINITGTGARIGTQSTNLQEFFNGQIDEVRIWNDARTAAEIRDNMNIALEGQDANLVAAYSFDRDATGSTGTVLNEQGTTALNGTRTNGATVEKSETAPVNEMPKPLGGVTGDVLSLDGSNDYLEVPDSVLNNRSTGTIEAWVFLNNTSETITAKQHDGGLQRRRQFWRRCR